MKKAIILVLVLLMALTVFAGCRSSSGSTTPSGNNSGKMMPDKGDGWATDGDGFIDDGMGRSGGNMPGVTRR